MTETLKGMEFVRRAEGTLEYALLSVTPVNVFGSEERAKSLLQDAFNALSAVEEGTSQEEAHALVVRAHKAVLDYLEEVEVTRNDFLYFQEVREALMMWRGKNLQFA